MTVVAPFDLLAVPLTISEDTVARGLLTVADMICMHQETRAYIERCWTRDKYWAYEHNSKFRRDRLSEYNDLKRQIDAQRGCLRQMLGPMMGIEHVSVGDRHGLLDAAAERIIATASQERQRARETGKRQWYFL